MAADPTPDSESEEADVTTGADDTSLHQEALERFDQIVQAVQEERALNLRDRRFCTIAGAQWEGDWAEQFANSIMVEVNKTAAGVEKIIRDYRANRITVEFRASDDKASEDTADLLNGMFRADVYNSKGQQAFDMGFEESVQGGMGAFRLVNDYDDDYDPDNDHQRIFFRAIPDADQSVFWDPNAKLYDKSDAMYAFVVTAVAKETYEQRYGDAGDWPTGLVKTWYEWYTPDVGYVAEYYEVREKEGWLRVYKNVATDEERREWAADLTPAQAQQMDTEGWRLDRTRRGKRRTVWKTVLSGAGVLEPAKQIAGTCIPIVPIYGKRWFIDNMERTKGHVRDAVDPQRIYNSMISKLTETNALAPIERPIFDPEQVQGLENGWATANIDRAPYALARALRNEDGSIAVPGALGKIEPPQLSPVLAGLVQVTAADIAELTDSQDGADEVRANVSQEAMELAAQRTDGKAGIYMDNMRQSMQRCGEIYLEMARDIYVEDGRVVDTLTEDGKSHGTATLYEPHVNDRGEYGIRNDLSRGRYKVISDVTEATTTRRDKTVRTLGRIGEATAAADPALSAAAFGTAIINMDGEGMNDLQDWVRARLVSQGIVKPTDEEKATLQAAQAQQGQQGPSPEEVVAQAAAAKDAALAEKYQADKAVSEAKVSLTQAQTVQTLADAHAVNEGIPQIAAEKRVSMWEKVVNTLRPKPVGKEA